MKIMLDITGNVEIKKLLDLLLVDIQRVLGSKFEGLYLYGSLVWGDFDYFVSDIDLLAVTSNDMTDQDYEGLKQMHADFAQAYSAWDNRIEVQYASEAGLKTFRDRPSKMAVISPGEPFHVIDAGKDRLTNWYFVQDYGLSLFGPDPGTFIPPISKAEFLQAVYDHALFWVEHIKQTKALAPYQSYAVLTMCRALYTCTNGEQVSKTKAAEWAINQMPEWKDFILRALYVRTHTWEFTQDDANRTYPSVVRFVAEVVNKLNQLRSSR
jgi:predicted nucleotidyltransferase